MRLRFGFGICLSFLLISSAAQAITCKEYIVQANQFFAKGFTSAHLREAAGDFQRIGSDAYATWEKSTKVDEVQLKLVEAGWKANSTAALNLTDPQEPFETDLGAAHLMRLVYSALNENVGVKYVMSGAIGIGQSLDLMDSQVAEFNAARKQYGWTVGVAGAFFWPAWVGGAGNEIWRRYYTLHVDVKEFIDNVRVALLLDKSKVTETRVLGIAARNATEWSMHAFVQSPNEEPYLFFFNRPADPPAPRQGWKLPSVNFPALPPIPNLTGMTKYFGAARKQTEDAALSHLVDGAETPTDAPGSSTDGATPDGGPDASE